MMTEAEIRKLYNSANWRNQTALVRRYQSAVPKNH